MTKHDYKMIIRCKHNVSIKESRITRLRLCVRFTLPIETMLRNVLKVARKVSLFV